jgi:phosphoribosylaminoimidazolecarboxamide formyltransferase/IMP cyclohydrolase
MAIALISVSDKTGIVEFAQALVEKFGFTIVSSGGTAKTLQEAGITVTKVGDYTRSPEILGGRVKTLHPRIHGGILARPDQDSDREDLAANDINPIDLVVVNLYPFEATVAKPGVTMVEAIENIDIGGPTMLRAAAKNFNYVTVITNPQNYDRCLTELEAHNGTTTLEFRQAMALETFALTNSYDQAITTYLSEHTDLAPDRFGLSGTAVATLRYGENPHQQATWYQTGTQNQGWAGATQLQGKELSYNNLVDLEAARAIIAEFPAERPAAAVLKHTNPCGAAIADDLATAYEKAFNADGVSAFGGIVALNRPIDEATAQALTTTFLECVVAPGCDPEAQAILAKKKNLRVLTLDNLKAGPLYTVKAIAGGFLTQKRDTAMELPEDWDIVTDKQPTPEQLAELLFAWRVVKHVKSNAIAVTKNLVTLGIGAGQMNRVGAAAIALNQAGAEAQNAFLASDAFFPFDDSVRTAAAAGIMGIVQPGGSIRDKDSIAAANELGLIMAFTGVRHFLH